MGRMYEPNEHKNEDEMKLRKKNVIILDIGTSDEEAKALRTESQKLTLDKQRVIWSLHEAFVKEKSSSLRQRRAQRHGSHAKQSSVVERVKQTKELLLNLESKVSFEKEI